MATLIARHLAKSYKKRQVVRDVSLRIDSGQIVGLLGPNSADKTTNFYMDVGLVRDDHGQKLIDELNVRNQPMHVRANPCSDSLPKDTSIFPKHTVTNNITAILEARKELYAEGRRSTLEVLLDQCRITHIRFSLCMSLSCFERRRV